ncbi:MAG: heme-binding domain-containing protein [Bacteroidales bacterium]|nr:heme-binding domain-containing protein [Candidatus Cryptobacteroides caccocaballi]
MKRVLTTILCLLLAVAAVVAVYRFGFRKSIPDAPVEEQVLAILTQNDCFVCHNQHPDLPFYAVLPFMGPKMREHVSHATDFIDLEQRTADLSQVDEVTLSMLDHSVSYDTMPMAEYKMVHWGTGFNRKEKSILAAWIREKRGSDEPIRPIPASIEYDKARAELGERMFNDVRLSLDGTISCATCHVLENGGADHADERVSEGINGLKGGVNAPTVYNSVYNVRQFWNGRAADLREQAEGPATNPVEMGDQSWDQIVERLGEDKELVREFEALYPGEGLTRETVTGAIAEFETSLITPDSRFDLYLGGISSAITPEELEGYELFKKNACATCHTGVAVGGRSFERLDIFGDYFADRTPEIAYNSDDDGLMGFTGNEADYHRFKVPVLRNIARTAPYFHDGSLQTLEEAVRAMAKYELGKNISDADVASIVAFMNTLTGTSPYYSLQD